MAFNALDWAKLDDARSRRSSSYDRQGGNRDRLSLAAGETAVLLDVQDAGCVTHIWITAASLEPYILRKLVLRRYWDGEQEPSVNVPLGDFFGMGHAESANFWSLPLVMAPSSGKGLNCYFPMPFSNGARIEVVSQNFVTETRLYFIIDYEEWPAGRDELGRFHAQWRRENPCRGIDDAGLASHTYLHAGQNTSDDYSSTAYWYQREPHLAFDLLPVNLRLPRNDFPSAPPDPANDIMTFLRANFTDDQIAQFLVEN